MSIGRLEPLRGVLMAAWVLTLVMCAAGQSSGTDIHTLVEQMTLDEKLALVHGTRDPNGLGQAGYWPGVPRLGIPPLRLSDGPAGVSVNQEATGVPAPVGLAATFSVETARRFGVVLGRDAKALGQDVLLAPYVNIVRDPLFRRNHTTLGEDPLLNARIGSAEIIGIQSQGVLAQVKHLAGYSGFDNVLIEERALHEIYLPAFEAAVKAGVASVMCAYNRINGAWACENSDLQNSILRERWGFQGFVTSDWGAVHSPLAITKGLDLEMPGREILNRSGPYFTEALKTAIEKGTVPVSAVDQSVERILSQMERFHLLKRKLPARPAPIDIEADARIIQDIAEQGAVLLKNEGNALPLTPEDLASLAVIGPTAGQLAAGYMGERAYGFESRLVSPLAALRKLAPQARITPELRRINIQAAVAAARAARTAVVFAWNEVGNSLSLPEEQDELIHEVAAANPRTIVVLNTGGPVAMPWKDSVRAILEMWYPGQEGGWATANLLLGRANPSGKLPVTFPARIEDAPARAAGHPERWATPPPPGSTGVSEESPTVTFSEGIAVGYRWYDQQGIQPLFPFGHGLSYTRFQYSNLILKRNGDGVDVTFALRNAGSRRGAEVAQVYVGPAHNPPVPMAPRSLVGFERVVLEPGQRRSVTVHVDARGLSYWSTEEHDWVVAGGDRPIYVGASSRDVRLEGYLPATIPRLP